VKDMTYSIGEVSQMLGIPISTLRYYDKKGIWKATTLSRCCSRYRI